MQRKASNSKISFGVKMAIGFSLFMFYRVSAGLYLPKVGDTIPEFWGIAYRGDILIGLTAPLIAYLLWKHRNLSTWTLAIVWHWIGLKDFIAGLEFHLIQPFDPAMGDLPILIFIIGPLIHIYVTYLLVRNRSDFFELEKN